MHIHFCPQSNQFLPREGSLVLFSGFKKNPESRKYDHQLNSAAILPPSAFLMTSRVKQFCKTKISRQGLTYKSYMCKPARHS